jgi:hypothetical protein
MTDPIFRPLAANAYRSGGAFSKSTFARFSSEKPPT